MGLIKKNYVLSDYNITIDSVYAKIVVISSENAGQSVATLQIRKTREDFDNTVMQPLKQISVPFIADKTLPLWEQAYENAKKEVFVGWEDDL